MNNCQSNCHASKVTLKILQARLQQYVNRELPDVQTWFRNGRRTKDQMANIHWIIKKKSKRVPEKHPLLLYWPRQSLWLCGSQQTVENSERVFLYSHHLDHLTCLLRNLYADQEATVRTGHGTTDWFQIRKEVRQGCILSPCLFNIYEEYIMRNTGTDEAQAGIKTAGRNMQMTPPLWQKVKKN